MRVAAIDPSLTATGVALSSGPAAPWILSPPRGIEGMARLHWIQKQVAGLAVGLDVVVIEGYSHNSPYQAHQLGELGGVIRLTLWCMGVPYVDVPPAARMKIATGKGQATKDAVLAEAIRRLRYEGNDHNEADAMWLLQLALHHYGLPGAAQLPASHLDPLPKAKPAWPEVATP